METEIGSSALLDKGNPQQELQEKGVIDSGGSRHITGNMSSLSEYEEIDGGYVAFRGDPKGGKITSKGKFDGKADEGFFVGYSTHSKALKVFNIRTKIIEENLHITFLENKPNVAGLKNSKDEVADDARKKSTKLPRKENRVHDPAKEDKDANGNRMFTPVSAAGSTYVYLGGSIPVNVATLPNVNLLIDPLMPDLKDTADIGILVVYMMMKLRVYRNKKDERGIVVRNKARLVAQGYTQEEGIDYDEVFAHVSRIEAIRLFFACVSFMGFIMYLMDVKSFFMYGTIEEEVYVCQPLGFEEPYFPNKVYVDDIIFGFTKKSLCTEFKGLMHKKFQISSMGELTFFLGLFSKAVWMDLDCAKVKTINEDVYIRALVDGKKIIVTETSIRRDLQLQDAKVTACLPIDTIIEELARMGTMASAIICLANNQKFNFSKYIFDNMEDASKQGRMINNIDQDEEITMVDETQGRMNKEDMFRVNDINGDEVIVDATAGEEVEHSIKVAKKEVSIVDPVTTAGEVVTIAEDVEVTTVATTPQIYKDELTLAQTLIEIKAAKPKARGVIVQEPSEFRTTSSSQPSQLPQAKYKGKRIMVEPEKPLKKKDKIAFDEEVTRKIKAQMKAEMEEEERIAREKDEANIAVIEQWNEVQAKTDADMELSQKLQIMNRVNTFVDMNREIVEERSKKTQAKVTKGSSKKSGDELEQESAKRQRLEKEDDSIELKRYLEIVPKDDDDDVTIDATPLSSKSPTIVDYKIYNEGKKSYFKIIRAD
nr:retrovirus-related Pol polyprotein from transposon TNT 1-94 [Tanacetum cinerariifolium]